MRFLFGGQATFEMAQQLRAQGQTVALLALLNAPAPGYPKPLPYTTAFGRVAQIVNRYWSDLKCLQPLSCLGDLDNLGRPSLLPLDLGAFATPYIPGHNLRADKLLRGRGTIGDHIPDSLHRETCEGVRRIPCSQEWSTALCADARCRYTNGLN
jgi:hypothetical protein